MRCVSPRPRDLPENPRGILRICVRGERATIVRFARLKRACDETHVVFTRDHAYIRLTLRWRNSDARRDVRENEETSWDELMSRCKKF